MKIIDFYRECVCSAQRDLQKQKMLLPEDTIADLCAEHRRVFRKLTEKLFQANGKAVVRSIQKAFPRQGTVNPDIDVLKTAEKYAAEHAAALAVVTEKHFYNGSPSMLTGITHLVDLPVIRWDFIVDEYQLMQSRLWGADAVRLIVPLLDQSELISLCNKASDLELELVLEVHSVEDIDRCLALADKSGVTFYLESDETEISLVEKMLKKIPETCPALLNGDFLSPENHPQLKTAGALFFRK